MNVIWQKSFEFALSVERVYAGYLEVEGPRDPEPGSVFTLSDVARSEIEITSVKEAEFLEWTERKGDEVAQMSVAFESTASGTRITVTRYGFGEGTVFEVFRESHMLGWTEGMQDLALYLHTGIRRRRHLEDRSATGVMVLETDAGLEVKDAGIDSLGTDVGLVPGDILLRIDGAALYERSHLWFVQRLFDPGREVEVGYARGGEIRTGHGKMRPIECATVGEVGLGPRED